METVANKIMPLVEGGRTPFDACRHDATIAASERLQNGRLRAVAGMQAGQARNASKSLLFSVINFRETVTYQKPREHPYPASCVANTNLATVSLQHLACLYDHTQGRTAHVREFSRLSRTRP